jgi:hypothetical protein
VGYYVQTSLVGKRVRDRDISTNRFPWWPFSRGDDDDTDEALCIGAYADERGAVLLVQTDDGRVGQVAVENVLVTQGAADLCGCPICGAGHPRGSC